ncbi:SRPBCC family protein [Streptomyces sp. NBC_01387]|uniref:SRPBCC family protein n=1 Tax=unclassified Streptomyces TaxID=2593676 RepID=UPI002023F161|nr:MULTISPECIES: SRPBCC family protein [unclassified Streptomyces]MCX4553390.1 SRPBCC family protein [Streptomyces sp. NBC_01500]WSC24469.1 SRPBCC family protein [Streptomyces sp. NBC_01766]WSV58447.1 SRPBCC family protein [Streptomyces sp. NBC_01014]
MTGFRIERFSALSPDEAWHRLTRWELHAAHVPLTRIRVVTPGPAGTGTGFVARTGLGRVGFDDPMEVVRWEPPVPGRAGVCRLEKRGRVVLGRAEIEVIPTDTGCRVVWREELRIAGLPRMFDGLTAWSGRLLFGRAVAGLLREQDAAEG